MGEDTIACVALLSLIKILILNYKELNLERKKKEYIIIQHVNAFNPKLKIWLVRFKGIKAKYLKILPK